MVKIFLKKRGHKPKLKSLPSLVKEYLDFGYSYYLQQFIFVPTRITENTATLIDHNLKNSPQKITQPGVIELNIKTTKFKSNKHNELNIRSMKNYTAKNFAEHLHKIYFPNCKSCSCINMAYLLIFS